MTNWQAFARILAHYNKRVWNEFHALNHGMTMGQVTGHEWDERIEQLALQIQPSKGVIA